MIDSDREELLNAAFRAFGKRGFNFTTDDLAEEMAMSKRTLYKRIQSKNQVIHMMIDQGKESIKKQQSIILDNQDLSLVEKLQKLLTVRPESHIRLAGKEMNTLKRRYPEEYEYIQKLYREDWEEFFKLMDRAVDDGCLRDINRDFFRDIYISIVTASGSEDPFLGNLEEITQLLFHGIVIKGDV